MIDLACEVASLVILSLAVLVQPTRAHCDHGWWLRSGVRPNGEFSCERVPIGGEHRNARGILIDDSIEPPGELRGRLYCTGGQRPIVVDGVSVGCQLGGWTDAE